MYIYSLHIAVEFVLGQRIYLPLVLTCLYHWLVFRMCILALLGPMELNNRAALVIFTFFVLGCALWRYDNLVLCKALSIILASDSFQQGFILHL